MKVIGEPDITSNEKKDRRELRDRGFAFFILLLLSLVTTSCLKLHPSPYANMEWIGLLFPDPICHTFYAYSSGPTFYSYSNCQPLTPVSVNGISGFRSVAKTASGFVAVDGTTNNVWYSRDSVNWTSTATFNVGTASPSGARVAACGGNVVVAYPVTTVVAGSNTSILHSTDGGLSFAAGAQADAASATIGDLVCNNGTFHISTGSSPFYKYSSNPASSWTAPTTAPPYTLVFSGLGVSGSIVVSYYQITSPGLTRSTNGGVDWTNVGTTTTGYPLSIAYSGGYFFAPYIGTGNACVMHRSVDGLTWDDSAADPCPSPSYGRAIYDVAGSGSTVMAVGYNNISSIAVVPVRMILLTTDGGKTWSAPLTSGSGYMYAVVSF